jgi:SnoaL-like domain
MNRIGASATIVTLAAVLATSACSGGGGATPTLASGLSETEISQADADMRDFADSYFGAWPNADEVVSQVSDDATFYDPTDGDWITGKPSIWQLLMTISGSYPDLAYRVNNVFVSADRALYQLEADGLWPPWVATPPDHPPVHEIQAVRLADGLLASTELAFAVSEMEMFPLGCFREQGCSDRYQQLVNGYISAWSSGDASQIAALYRDDAVFTDSLLGLSAQGAQQIGQLAQARFGAEGQVDLEVVDQYAQTYGYGAAYSNHPYVGAVIAAPIRYRATMAVGGQPITRESFTFLRFASWTPAAGLSTEPDGRIVEERVFHDAASLSSWLEATSV